VRGFVGLVGRWRCLQKNDKTELCDGAVEDDDDNDNDENDDNDDNDDNNDNVDNILVNDGDGAMVDND
jgi:hypothetical protein